MSKKSRMLLRLVDDLIDVGGLALGAKNIDAEAVELQR